MSEEVHRKHSGAELLCMWSCREVISQNINFSDFVSVHSLLSIRSYGFLSLKTSSVVRILIVWVLRIRIAKYLIAYSTSCFSPQQRGEMSHSGSRFHLCVSFLFVLFFQLFPTATLILASRVSVLFLKSYRCIVRGFVDELILSLQPGSLCWWRKRCRS